ncbi:hypothetical protein [Pseudomonas aeruginosa]|uniref:hypothetical protein n=1 Tax=Pseudomonas aeruginosa TaxID=287 RepID=UPI0022B6FC53|nr:hypothetical protein [Pseudomonas aeruginosa]MCZ7719902.1 hypothetical protein [Pseudomonas aeruginosa]MCZ7823894.1 hypothetical protein [Pseudomonas aeruginosa]MDI3812003.1 hypothetical protein [Pseudomonas aeruginosa]MDI4056913.1 hypothetical protein [Pseudomonas aeruginosa]MDI4167036.1 hypothetical protein [Pseudomonas aeruginosa]
MATAQPTAGFLMTISWPQSTLCCVDAGQDAEGAMAESLDENMKAGILIILTAFVLIVATLLFSDGYHPEGGLLWSLSNQMAVYDGYPTCEDADSTASTYLLATQCADYFHLVIKSKYLIVAWLALALFGVARFFGIAKPACEYLPKNL